VSRATVTSIESENAVALEDQGREGEGISHDGVGSASLVERSREERDVLVGGVGSTNNTTTILDGSRVRWVTDTTGLSGERAGVESGPGSLPIRLILEVISITVDAARASSIDGVVESGGSAHVVASAAVQDTRRSRSNGGSGLDVGSGSCEGAIGVRSGGIGSSGTALIGANTEESSGGVDRTSKWNTSLSGPISTSKSSAVETNSSTAVVILGVVGNLVGDLVTKSGLELSADTRVAAVSILDLGGGTVSVKEVTATRGGERKTVVEERLATVCWVTITISPVLLAREVAGTSVRGLVEDTSLVEGVGTINVDSEVTL